MRLKNLSMSFGIQQLFNNVNLYISENEKVGVIGVNGSGKTTLFKIIMVILESGNGEIIFDKKERKEWLPQVIEDEIPSMDITVLDFLLLGRPIEELEKQLHITYEKVFNETDLNKQKALYNKINNLQHQLSYWDHYNADNILLKIISGMNISDSLLGQKLNTLSGGQKSKVAFARLLYSKPEIILLDEPTNHLDIDTLEWLEEFLSTYDGTILIVSHDRYFLNKVCNKTVLIEKGCLEIFHGNYDYYLKENENRIMLEFKNYNNQQKQIEAMKKSIKKLREWGKIGDNEIFFKRANNIEKRLEKMEKFDKPSIKKELPISFDDNIRSGNDVLVVKDFSFKYSDKELFNNISFIIRYGERVCLLGENGSGKTTLINQIIENNSDNIKLGSNIKIGYIPQIIYFDDESKTVLETAREVFYGDETNLRSILFQFLFYGENIHKRINALSGGEKVRLKLFELIQQEINFLILDEPTNHIDIDTKEVLENALLKFKGTILLISHDRYFINKIVDKVLLIRDNKVKEYIGNYDDIKEKI